MFLGGARILGIDAGMGNVIGRDAWMVQGIGLLGTIKLLFHAVCVVFISRELGVALFTLF